MQLPHGKGVTEVCYLLFYPMQFPRSLLYALLLLAFLALSIEHILRKGIPLPYPLLLVVGEREREVLHELLDQICARDGAEDACVALTAYEDPVCFKVSSNLPILGLTDAKNLHGVLEGEATSLDQKVGEFGNRD